MEHVQLVGGSGALFGMLGAALALNVRGGRTILDFLENRGARWLISIVVLNLLAGFFITIVSNSAHVGGLVSGFVLVYCFLDTGRRAKVNATGRTIQAGWIAVFLALLLYQTHPVLRFDHNLVQYLRETDPARRARIRAHLENYDDLRSMSPRAQMGYVRAANHESAPQTGIAAVAHREKNAGSLYRRAIRRWKRGN